MLKKVFFLAFMASAFSCQTFASAESTARGMYEEGLYQESLPFWLECELAGRSVCSLALGVYYEDGLGVEINLKTAFDHYYKAAVLGDAFAQFKVFEYYSNTSVFGGEHLLEANSWLKKSAEGGNDKAQVRMAIYAEIDGDFEKQHQWSLKAAEQGHTNAQFSVGYNFLNGKGVAKNDSEAYSWINKSARAGHPRAQYFLAMVFEDGQVVQRNYIKSYMWAVISNGNGSIAAKGFAALLETKMLDQNVKDAITKAKVCVDSKYVDC